MVFLSLASELALDSSEGADLDRANEHWSELLGRLRGAGARTFVLNVFRRVPDPRADGSLEGSGWLRERIRRLNRMGDELAARGETALVDVDRAFGSIGGRELQVDFRWPRGPGSEGATSAAAGAVMEALNGVVLR
jgi:hypothetical protein